MTEFSINVNDVRDVVLTRAKEFTIEFLSIETDREFCLIIREIVKNIYDHSNGGKITFMKESGRESIIFESCCEPLTLTRFRHDYNYHFGLTLINDLCRTISNKLKLTKDKNWSYRGFYEKF
jgi:nitrate/nitrite-specific signal transduction histidine kinase